MQKDIMMMITASTIRLGPIPFSLYTRDAENRMVLFCRKGLSISEEHKSSLKRGNTVFYINSEDMDDYLDYTFEKIDRIVRSDEVKVREKTKILIDVGKKVVNNLITNPRSGEAIHKSKRFIASTTELLLSTPEASMVLLSMVDENSYLLSHSISTCVFTLLIGIQKYGRDAETLHNLGLGGLVLDIGMTKVEKSILFKNEGLSKNEWLEVRDHSRRGANLLKEHKLPDTIIDMVLYHHERLDGSGYPFGLKGEDIPEHVRIAAVADVYDALTTDRSYRKANIHLQALRLLARDIEKFDQNIYESLLKVVLQHDDLIEKFSLQN